MSKSSTTLFTDLASIYAAYRPPYPSIVYSTVAEYRPTPATVADIGAGTGIFSRGLSQVGYRVIAIEPNAAMQVEARRLSPPHLGISVMDGSGEATGLPAGSIDLVTLAQSFHWLDRAKAAIEFKRIGRRGCLIAVVWNARQFDATEFMRGYRQLLFNYAPEYRLMKERFWSDLDSAVNTFFPTRARRFRFANTQYVNRDAMIGNLLSTSYVPKTTDSHFGPMVEAALALFDKHAMAGTVPFDLETILYIGSMS